MARLKHIFLKNGSRIFFAGGLDRWNRVERVGEIGFSAQKIFGSRAPIVGVATVETGPDLPDKARQIFDQLFGLKGLPSGLRDAEPINLSSCGAAA